MASGEEQQLLYALRSPTSLLNDKLALAASSLSTSLPGTSLPQLIRDWLLDTLWKLIKSNSTSTEQALVNGQLWELLSATTEQTQTASTVTPILPIYVAFIQTYVKSEPKDAQVLKAATRVWVKLATTATRKGTIDTVLDSYDKLVRATLELCGAEANRISDDWEQLAVVWLRSIKPIMTEAAKGGKKVPTFTLNLLPTLVPLLHKLPATSSLRSALLQTIQLSLFNLDNLRRGLARESYATGGSTTPSASSTTTTADSELLAALTTLPRDARAPVYAALPSLTHIYLDSLSINSTLLFPLPAKATFPTPSAQKSALEVLGLGKRRELAGRWVRGVLDLIAWGQEAGGDSEAEKAQALAQVLGEVESGDLYRPGQAGEAWEGVLPSVTLGAVERLERVAPSDDSKRDAIVQVLCSVHRLEYEALEQQLSRVLAVLAQTSSTFSNAGATSDLLKLLLTHHSRSLTMPTLLSSLSDALALSPYTAPNNLLTTTSFASQLGRSISAMLASATSICSTWNDLLTPVSASLRRSTSETDEMAVDVDAENVPSPAKKRKLATSASDLEPTHVLSAAARLRVLTSFVQHLPTAALESLGDSFEAFVEETVDPTLKEFAKAATRTRDPVTDAIETPSKKAKKSKRKSAVGLAEVAGAIEAVEPIVLLGTELLEARYAIVSRLRGAGLLVHAQPEQGTKWTMLKEKRREGLRQIVEKGSGAAVVVSARVLLQQLEISRLDDASTTLDAVLTRLSGSTTAHWSGMLRAMSNEQVPVALWEMVSRRWLPVFESYASEEQLKHLARVIIRGLADGNDSGHDQVTQRLFKRSDFWEFPSLQAQVRPALLNLVSLPSFPSPVNLLPLLSTSSPSKELSALKSTSAATLLATSRTYSRLSGFVPLEYLGRDFRTQLAEQALSLDLWISAGENELQAEQKESAQADLRTFVGAMGTVVEQAPSVLAVLVGRTLPGAKSATLALYRTLIQTSLSTFSDSKSPKELLAFLEAFGDKPCSDLAKRAKKDSSLSSGLTCEESAYALFLELLANNLGDISSLPAALSDRIRSSIESATKPFAKVLTSVSSARTTYDAFQMRDLLEATRCIWTAKDWLSTSVSASDERELTFAEFVQTALTATISQLPAAISTPSALPTCLSLLDLVSYRIRRLRSMPVENKVDVRPYETLVATQLFFRQLFGSSAYSKLDESLVKATASATLGEYEVALEGVSATVSSAASARTTCVDLHILEASLSMATILLRDGPEGSVKISSSAFSDLLRHLSLLVETLAEKPNQDGHVAQTYLLVATFLDGVCADRPMLLSRLNVSSVLSLVSRILQPSVTTSPVVSTAASAEIASALVRALASTVGHIVRHRKDHVTPLFPQLVSTLSAFLSILRRAGYGTTGSAASIEDGTTGIVLGQRAEREARATFPAWAWQGGASGINTLEAAAVGRLLGSLTAKTAVVQHKNKQQEQDAHATTTSLTAPLSKHAPFLLLAYLRACVHPTCPIPSALRGELQGGWYEVMDSMGKWEREALMKGFLNEDEEAERGVLRGLWKSWEKERYRG
ncbi:Urb2 domain-containing protein [Sporobolomyces koalae]|uniref:Urb2 domain-containing protein n=1 Tax=Sporobolomyces koalae TaxID=500713 RepID=UPI0031738862